MNAAECNRPVVFFLPSLGGGGAERHLLRVVNHADWPGLAPQILLARRGGAYEAALRPGIPCGHLLPAVVRSSAASMLLAALPLRRRLRELRPAAVCSLLNHTHVVLHWALRDWPARLGPRPRLLLGVQNNPSRDLAPYQSRGGRWFAARLRAAFAAADRIVALSQGVADDFSARFPAEAARVAVIPNAGFDGEAVVPAAPMPRSGNGARRLITCGRLTPQKNQALLLRALARVRRELDVRLGLLGEGALRPELEKLSASLGLTGAVTFHGFQPRPDAYVAGADAFVLSSDWEGFGNVLVEAMVLGVPVISTDCPYGPAEIITHGRDGLLVPCGSEEALAVAIVQVCTQPGLARGLGVAGARRAQDFHPARIAALYGGLLAEMLQPQARPEEVPA
jgi:glycosyltransferase involved in cell wall biosynthesis